MRTTSLVLLPSGHSSQGVFLPGGTFPIPPREEGKGCPPLQGWSVLRLRHHYNRIVVAWSPITPIGGTIPPLEGAHLILFWLALAAYGAEAGFRLAGVAPSSIWKSPVFAGVLLHAAFLGIRWPLSGHAPMAGLFESLTVFSFCCAVAG